MMSWASNTFLQYRESAYKNLMAKKDCENITHHHIFHSVLGCVGVESSAIDGSLNLCK